MTNNNNIITRNIDCTVAYITYYGVNTYDLTIKQNDNYTDLFTVSVDCYPAAGGMICSMHTLYLDKVSATEAADELTMDMFFKGMLAARTIKSERDTLETVVADTIDTMYKAARW